LLFLRQQNQTGGFIVRITVLAFLEADADEPDVVVPQVANALREHGHEVKTLVVHDDLVQLATQLREQRPELVFNLLEAFGENILGGQMGATGVLDLLQIPYTGGGPGELYLQEDKALSKKLLAYEQILYPDFASFAPSSEFETGGKLRMPLFVKPQRSDASIGIDAKKSLVRDTQQLLEQVSWIQKELGDTALAEEYIEGREFYVGVVGNIEPQALPIIEMDFSGMPSDTPKVLDNAAKFDETSERFKGTKAIVAELPPELNARLQKVAIDAYRALRVRDYGRIDLRLTDSGEIYVIEVNANCYLERNSEFAMAAKAAGLEYRDLVKRIVDVASERWQKRAEWQKK
jgi:D-alanine-D-alanine ligase